MDGQGKLQGGPLPEHFLCLSLFWEMIPFDYYFSNGLKPPTSYKWAYNPFKLVKGVISPYLQRPPNSIYNDRIGAHLVEEPGNRKTQIFGQNVESLFFYEAKVGCRFSMGFPNFIFVVFLTLCWYFRSKFDMQEDLDLTTLL